MAVNLCDRSSCIDVPAGHVGPVLLSATGRTVWWTGRVAIGLRYQPPQYGDCVSESALWVQDLLLEELSPSAGSYRPASCPPHP